MRHNLSMASATLGLLVVLISVTACERKTQSAEAKVVTVTIRDFKFDPPTVTIHEGDTVEWKNAGNVAHTATADGQAQKPAFNSGNIANGASWRYVAGTKGTYNYICTIHPYMKGELIVQ